MTASPHRPDGGGGAPLGLRGLVALAALLIVPLALSWPLPRLLDPYDPEPWTAAAGWSALVTVAATVALAWRLTALPRAAALALLPAAGALAGWALGAATEPLETSRQLTTLSAGLAAFVLAAALARDERVWLARGLVLATLVHGLPTLVEGADRLRLAGPLQNTGYADQVLLPGAAAGAVLLALGPGLWRALGGAAVLVHLTHAGLAPTLSGALALAVGVGAAACGPRPARGRSLLLGVAAAALLAALTGALPRSAAPDGADARPAPTVADGDLGGVGVRLSVWRRSAVLIADAGPFGFGPGRFRAEFPRVRDPREASAAESVGTRARTEVEHPHNDWLAPWVEWGWLGGLAWLGFLGAGLAAALAGTTSAAPGRAALGAAALATLVNAAVHSNLLFNPLSGLLGLAALGASAGTWRDDAAGGPPRAGRGLARLVAVAPLALLLAAPLAPWRLVENGDAMAAHLRLTERLVRAAEPELAAVVERRAALEAALAASADSNATALELAIQQARIDRAPTAEDAYVERLRELRPHSPATLEAVALRAVDRDEWETARAAFETLLERRPGDPTTALNLTRLHLERGRAEEALAVADATGLDGERRVALARDAQLGGWVAPEAVAALLAPAFDDVSPEALYERADRLRDQDTSPVTRAGLECLAHHLWAREHAAGGDFPTAARVYRQAWRASRDADRPGSPLIRLELAAAERLAGNQARALDVLDGARLERPAALAGWAAQALFPADEAR